jgi:hypothetical protein
VDNPRQEVTNMKKWSGLLAGVMVVLGGGCASPERAPADSVQRLNRVAVVSTAAGVFARTYTGVTVFGNERHVRPVPEWGLNRLYEAQMTEVLRTRHGLTVVDAKLDPAPFAKVDRSYPDKWPGWGGIEDLTRKTCADHQLDGLFVLAKVGDWGLQVSASNHPQSRHGYLGISAQLALLDCRTGRPLAARLLQNGALEAKVLYNRVSPPIMALPETWPRYGDWTPELYEQARVELVRLPQRAWGDTLDYMLKSAAR